MDTALMDTALSVVPESGEESGDEGATGAQAAALNQSSRTSATTDVATPVRKSACPAASSSSSSLGPELVSATASSWPSPFSGSSISASNPASGNTATPPRTRSKALKSRTVSDAPETSRRRSNFDYLDTVRFATIHKPPPGSTASSSFTGSFSGAREEHHPGMRQRTGSITLSMLTRSDNSSWLDRFRDRSSSNTDSGLFGGSSTSSGSFSARRPILGSRRDSSVHAVDLGVLESMRLQAEQLQQQDQQDTPEVQEEAQPPSQQLQHTLQSRVSSEPQLTGADPALASEDLEDEGCLICLGKFTEKRPSVPIPCLKHCNLAPVHAKCIYEWKEQKKGAGTCPLCRSELGYIDYQPPDLLKLNSLVIFGYRKQFAMSPLPKEAGMLRCYVKLRNGVFGSPVHYELWVQAPTTLAYPLGALPDQESPRKGDRFLMAGQKRLTAWGTSVIDFTLDPNAKDFNSNSYNYIGSVSGNFAGTEFTVNAPYKEGRYTKQRELASIAYAQNRLVGSTFGPRHLTCALAKAKAWDGSATSNPNLGLPLPSSIPTSVSSTSSTATLMSGGGSPNPASNIAPLDIPSPSTDDRQRSSSAQTITSSPAMGSPVGFEAAHEAPQLVADKNGASTAAQYNVDDDDDDDDDYEIPTQTYMTDAIIPKQRNDHIINYLRKGPEAVNNHEKLVYGQNKDPYWLDAIQAYSLDFRGRVQRPSNKNFQLELEGLQKSVSLQFGKVVAIDEHCPFAIYTCDFQWPLSPIQAFGIVTTACDRKMFVA